VTKLHLTTPSYDEQELTTENVQTFPGESVHIWRDFPAEYYLGHAEEVTRTKW